MPRVMIVVGHPQTNTLCEALAKAYKIGAEAAGHAGGNQGRRGTQGHDLRAAEPAVGVAGNAGGVFAAQEARRKLTPDAVGSWQIGVRRW